MGRWDAMTSTQRRRWTWIAASYALVAGVAIVAFQRCSAPSAPETALTPDALPSPTADAAVAIQADADSSDEPMRPMPGKDAATQGGQAAGDNSDPAGDEGPGAVDDSAEATETTPPLAIDTEPDALRVWHNTAMRLRVVPRVEEAGRWLRFVWHFEDGSRAIEGETVLHVFPESVADRHVTVEAFRRDGSRLVVSRRLPIERLAVVPIDGEVDETPKLPRARAGRFLLVGAGDESSLAALWAAVQQAGVVAVVAVGPASWADSVARSASSGLPDAAVLAFDDAVEAEGKPAAQGEGASPPLLRVVRAAVGAVAELPESGALVVGEIAIVPFDSRPLVVGEPALAALRRDLRLAAAWPALVVLTPRPLAALRDGEVVADRAYRVYEHALRERAIALVSTTSGVAWDGRYGGLAAIAVGQLRPNGCARLTGSDVCQPSTATLLEVRESAVRSWHLQGPKFHRWLSGEDLPNSVGRYRRDLLPTR